MIFKTKMFNQLLNYFVIFTVTYFCAVHAQIGGGSNKIDAQNPVVQTRFGLVRGSKYTVTTQRKQVYNFIQFIGIPYAAAPTGSLRFRVIY